MNRGGSSRPGTGLGIAGLRAASWPLGWGSGLSRVIVEQQLGDSRGPRVRLAGNSPPEQWGRRAGSHSSPAGSAPTLGGPVSWEQMPPRGWGGSQPAPRYPTGLGPPACSVAQLCPTLQPHGLQSAWLLCPWDPPGENTGWATCRQTVDSGSVSEQRGRGLGSWEPSSSPHLLQIHPVQSPKL